MRIDEHRQVSDYKPVKDCLEAARNGRFCAGAESAMREIESLTAEGSRMREALEKISNQANEEWHGNTMSFPVGLERCHEIANAALVSGRQKRLDELGITEEDIHETMLPPDPFTKPVDSSPTERGEDYMRCLPDVCESLYSWAVDWRDAIYTSNVVKGEVHGQEIRDEIADLDEFIRVCKYLGLTDDDSIPTPSEDGQ